MFNHRPGSYPQYGPQYPQYGTNMPYNQFVPSTNKQFVRSLEEALSLPADLNSQNIYFDTNENVMYDICTNGQGEKSWAIFDITPRQVSSKQSTQTNAFEERFNRLEKMMEDLVNGKYNVKPTDGSNASAT